MVKTGSGGVLVDHGHGVGRGVVDRFGGAA
jgi:hypothetical protein